MAVEAHGIRVVVSLSSQMPRNQACLHLPPSPLIDKVTRLPEAIRELDKRFEHSGERFAIDLLRLILRTNLYYFPHYAPCSYNGIALVSKGRPRPSAGKSRRGGSFTGKGSSQFAQGRLANNVIKLSGKVPSSGRYPRGMPESRCHNRLCGGQFVSSDAAM